MNKIEEFNKQEQELRDAAKKLRKSSQEHEIAADKLEVMADDLKEKIKVLVREEKQQYALKSLCDMTRARAVVYIHGLFEPEEIPQYFHLLKITTEKTALKAIDIVSEEYPQVQFVLEERKIKCSLKTDLQEEQPSESSEPQFDITLITPAPTTVGEHLITYHSGVVKDVKLLVGQVKFNWKTEIKAHRRIGACASPVDGSHQLLIGALKFNNWEKENNIGILLL